MKTLRQLLRQPLKSIAGLLLAALAAGLLCANAGQYIAALRTREQIEQDYTTAALPTGKYIASEYQDSSGAWVEWPEEWNKLLDDLEKTRPDLIRRVDRLGLISGYCPAIDPLNYVRVQSGILAEVPEDFNGGWLSVTSDPYTGAVFAVTLEEIGKTKTIWPRITLGEITNPIFPLPFSYQVSLVAHIDQVVFLQEGYLDPTGRTLRFTVTGVQAEDLEALDLRVGQRYLVAGDDYHDDDWWLRRYLLSWPYLEEDTIDAIDWGRITLKGDIKDMDLLESIEYLDSISNEETLAVYGEPVYGNRALVRLNQYELDHMNASSLSAHLSAATRYVYWPSVFDETRDQLWQTEPRDYSVFESEEYRQAVFDEYAQFDAVYREPSIARLNGTVEEFLASPEGELWNRFIDQESVSSHALPVLTTSRLESVVQFVRGDALITQGRSFTEGEYAAGSRVCVLSESLATANGLSVGDRIPLALYIDDPNRDARSATLWANPTAERYSAVQGFAAEEEEYEIVGLYRQTNEWSWTSYAFLPNTVFVPERAVTAQTKTSSNGIFRTLILQNGKQDKLQEILDEAGYPEMFVYYDQGYTKIAPQLDNLMSNTLISFIAGGAAWAVILLLFLALFPLSQKKTAERMWALGAQSGHIRRHVLVVGVGLAVPGTVLGGVLGYVLLQNALEKAAAESGLALTMEPWTVPVLAGAQLLCCVIAIFLCGVFVARTGEKDKPSS